MNDDDSPKPYSPLDWLTSVWFVVTLTSGLIRFGPLFADAFRTCLHTPWRCPVSKIEPNPYSPYADADPRYRHLVEVTFFGRPPAGALVPAACERMTVVPEELTEAATLAEPPEGLCPVCVAVMNGEDPPEHTELSECRDCETTTAHGDLCALCRQEQHEEWWPTRHEGKAING